MFNRMEFCVIEKNKSLTTRVVDQATQLIINRPGVAGAVLQTPS